MSTQDSGEDGIATVRVVQLESLDCWCGDARFAGRDVRDFRTGVGKGDWLWMQICPLTGRMADKVIAEASVVIPAASWYLGCREMHWTDGTGGTGWHASVCLLVAREVATEWQSVVDQMATEVGVGTAVSASTAASACSAEVVDTKRCGEGTEVSRWVRQRIQFVMAVEQSSTGGVVFGDTSILAVLRRQGVSMTEEMEEMCALAEQEAEVRWEREYEERRQRIGEEALRKEAEDTNIGRRRGIQWNWDMTIGRRISPL